MGNNMRIKNRKAELRDAKAIAELHKKVVNKINARYYSAEAIKEWLKGISEENVKHQFQNSDWIVAETGDKLVGFGQYSSDGKIYQINVDPDYLGQNIGKGVYEYIENDFISRGIEKIDSNSTLNAVEFYRKLGFRTLEETYVGSIKLLKMEKLCGRGDKTECCYGK
jgi:ribosomal protein S18 acetylase RimI-like enzyme